MSNPANLLFALGYDDPNSLIGGYIRHVANGGLTAYKTILQTGAKAGEPVYVHFLNGVFTAERLRPLLDLSDVECRVLYSAYSVHDLNKVVDTGGRSFNAVATKESVRGELEKVGVPAFFPAYLEYLEDITFLVRYHSGHYHTAGEFLIRAVDPYRLDRDRLQRVLGPLMRALDGLELSTTLAERANKHDFLAFLNSVTDRQYVFVTHRVAEQRGLLTNMVHNRVTTYLEDRYGLVPLLFYPEGVAYLAERDRVPDLTDEDVSAVGQAVARAAAGLSRGSFAKFIRSGNQGIVVNEQCLELGVPFGEIFNIVYNHVAAKVTGKRFDVQTNEGKARAALAKAAGEAKHAGLAPDIISRLARPHFYPPSQEGMGAGELLRAYYIFLSDHLQPQVGDPWSYLYAWLRVSDEAVVFYNLLDPRYQRAYVVAHDLGLRIDPLYERILADGARLMPGGAEDDGQLGDYAVLADYVAQTVRFDFGGQPDVDFRAALRAYVENNHHQCCYCGSEFPTEKWMAVQVPANVTVQSFSNRLPGGSSAEPKRHACDVCRVQFTLEKLTHPAGKGMKTVYVHLYPYSFYTDVFLKALRAEVREVLAQDTTVLFPRTDEAFHTFLAENRIELVLLTRNRQGKPYQNGVVLPQYAEAIGNVLIFPLNCPGDSEAEQFLFALQNALLVQRFFGCKAVLTESAVPVLDKGDFADLFVDHVRLGFEGLVSRTDLDTDALRGLWRDVLALHHLREELYNPEREENPMLSLARSLAGDSRLAVLYVADRLVEHKAAQGRPDKTMRTWRSIAISQRILPDLRELTKGGVWVNQLQQLAHVAREGWIIGRSRERNSLLKPFDMMLEGLEAQSEAFGPDTLRAQLVEDIFRHLEVIAPEGYKPGHTKREKVKAYVAQFFDGVLDEVYRNNRARLLADAKGLRSAYLFYLRERINLKSASEDDSDNMKEDA